MTSVPNRGRFATAFSIVLLAATLAMQLFAIAVRADREPHMDENEYMHAGWLMANGGKLYETFFEHHSPLFFKTLELLAPEGERVDVRPYYVQARRLCGLFGLVALIAFAALLWRVGPEASAIGVALLVATGPLWLRSFLEVRAETFAIAFFCIGSYLALRWRGIAGGFGIGLVAFSCLWQPKWPLACVAIGLIWLGRTLSFRPVEEASRRFPLVAGMKAAGAALATAAAGLLAVAAIVPLDMWWFFNFEMNVALASAVETPWVMNSYFQGGVPFLFVPDAFHPWLVVPGALLVLAAFRFDRSVWRLFPVALLLAAFLEIRFIYPWPAIWSHYYLMWSIASAAVLGAVPSSLAILLARTRASEQLARTIVLAVTCAGLLLSAMHVVAVTPVTGDAATYWVSQKYLREHLQSGETIWIESPRHPVSARDAHYYWFSVGQMTHAAREMRKTPRGLRYLPPPENFPVCNPAAKNVRYTLDPRRAGVVEAAACMEQLVTTGQVRKTVFFDVWEIRLKSAPDSAPVKGNP
ncbi:MAG TPA: hypothetical protein VE974_17470 [Thermoanaerobaculia bacterium]|nr:hypothetical protein [Thermoanaerobaculia bacterium]